METFKIGKYQSGQETLIYQLIRKVYDEFVASDYPDEGNRFFYDWIDPSNIARRQINHINIHVAWIDSEVVGMIEFRDNNRISLLFVDKEHQRKGIAKRLLQEALGDCRLNGSEPDKIYVHASPYSVPVYKKLGFIETDIMQEEHGIKYLPMEMILAEADLEFHP